MLRLHYENETSLPAHASPAVSAVMFSAGVLGNVTALALLVAARRRRRARRERLAPFHVLVLALVVTDLLGTCLTSPVVLAAYWRGRSLEALRPGLCAYFAFAMSFFGLATMGSLGAMALERSLAVGAPYLYARLLRGRRVGLLLGALLLPLLYALAAAFCALPLLGFGRYVQYWPGTWCFIQMREAEGEAPSSGRGSALTYSLLYASLLLLLILAVVLCNLSVIVNLLRMHRRSKHARLAAASSSLRSQRPRSHLGGPDDGEGEGRAPPPGRRRRRAYSARQAPSMSEELDHIILLAIMTITFAVCSLPFTVSGGPGLERGGGQRTRREAPLTVVPWGGRLLRVVPAPAAVLATLMNDDKRVLGSQLRGAYSLKEPNNRGRKKSGAQFTWVEAGRGYLIESDPNLDGSAHSWN